MLRAIVFDFNGVILNDEPLHFHAMRDAAAGAGIFITRDEYWRHYLPLDDGQCLEAICRNHAARLTERQCESLLAAKAEIYRRLLKRPYPLFPGVVEFVRSAAEKYPLALASGAKRAEIEEVLEAEGLRKSFRVIAAAEDFVIGKPHPESFLQALELLNEDLDENDPILPGDCLVIEDSVESVRGARKAGMLCIAMSNTYTPEELGDANLVVRSLQDLSPAAIEKLAGGAP